MFYDKVYKPMSSVSDVPHNRFELGVLHTNGSTDANTLEVSRNNRHDLKPIIDLLLLTWLIRRLVYIMYNDETLLVICGLFCIQNSVTHLQPYTMIAICLTNPLMTK